MVLRAKDTIERIRVTRSTVCMNRVVMVGEVLDVSQGLDPRDAELLVRLGKAVEIPVAPLPETLPADKDVAAEIPGQAGDNPRPSLIITTETA